MKHTDLHNEYEKLDAIEKKELIAAVKAHGGEYVFIHIDDDGYCNEEEKNNAPIIMASTRCMDHYEDFYVSRVEIYAYHLIIYGWPIEGYEDEREIDSIAHGHLGYVIDHIPETNDVKDVTNIPDCLPILFLNKSDIEAIGYNADISSMDFQSVAACTANLLSDEDFEESLREACEHLGLTHLK